MATTTVSNPRVSFSLPSILAVVAAIGSFYAGAFFGLVLAVLAILFGVIGIVLALAPSVRGGLASIIAILAGGAGIVAAVIKAIAWIAS